MPKSKTLAGYDENPESYGGYGKWHKKPKLESDPHREYYELQVGFPSEGASDLPTDSLPSGPLDHDEKSTIFDAIFDEEESPEVVSPGKKEDSDSSPNFCDKPRLSDVKWMMEAVRRGKAKRKFLQDMDVLKAAGNSSLSFEKPYKRWKGGRFHNYARPDENENEEWRGSSVRRSWWKSRRRILKSSRSRYPLKSQSRDGVPSLDLNPDDVTAYLWFLSHDTTIQEFLRNDYCYRISDKWILAMVFVYYQRIIQMKVELAGKRNLKFNRDTFFTLLFLANEAEEDQDEHRQEILAWALGETYLKLLHLFFDTRVYLLRLLNYRIFVATYLLEQVMKVNPREKMWLRERVGYHSGARRRKEDPNLLPSPFVAHRYPRGFGKIPVWCPPCIERKWDTGILPFCIKDKLRRRKRLDDGSRNG